MAVVVAGALGGRRNPAFTEDLSAKNDMLCYIFSFNPYKEIILSPFER